MTDWFSTAVYEKGTVLIGKLRCLVIRRFLSIWTLQVISYAFLLVLLFFPSIGLPETSVCPGQSIIVNSDRELSQKVCNTAALAISQLRECHLQQIRPLEISIVESVDSEYHNFLGFYDNSAEHINILKPSSLRDLLEPDSAFYSIPSEILFESLVAHELTHAFFNQMSNENLSSITANEYMAYAMQLEFMPVEVRQTLLDAHPVQEPIEILGLNGMVWLMAPEVFAVKAWKHFDYPENGCGIFRKIIDGKIIFESPNLHVRFPRQSPRPFYEFHLFEK